jgi:acyl-coenzyme A synthetase/AMP-(fatty) acid ligase
MYLPPWPRRSSSVFRTPTADRHRWHFVTLRAGEFRTGDELRDFLRDRISAIELPLRVEIRDSLPKTVIGKLSRKELLAELAASH